MIIHRLLESFVRRSVVRSLGPVVCSRQAAQLVTSLVVHRYGNHGMTAPYRHSSSTRPSIFSGFLRFPQRYASPATCGCSLRLPNLSRILALSQLPHHACSSNEDAISICVVQIMLMMCLPRMICHVVSVSWRVGLNCFPDLPRVLFDLISLFLNLKGAVSHRDGNDGKKKHLHAKTHTQRQTTAQEKCNPKSRN